LYPGKKLHKVRAYHLPLDLVLGKSGKYNIQSPDYHVHHIKTAAKAGLANLQFWRGNEANQLSTEHKIVASLTGICLPYRLQTELNLIVLEGWKYNAVYFCYSDPVPRASGDTVSAITCVPYELLNVKKPANEDKEGGGTDADHHDDDDDSDFKPSKPRKKSTGIKSPGIKSPGIKSPGGKHQATLLSGNKCLYADSGCPFVVQDGKAQTCLVGLLKSNLNWALTLIPNPYPKHNPHPDHPDSNPNLSTPAPQDVIKSLNSHLRSCIFKDPRRSNIVQKETIGSRERLNVDHFDAYELDVDGGADRDSNKSDVRARSNKGVRSKKPKSDSDSSSSTSKSDDDEEDDDKPQTRRRGSGGKAARAARIPRKRSLGDGAATVNKIENLLDAAEEDTDEDDEEDDTAKQIQRLLDRLEEKKAAKKAKKAAEAAASKQKRLQQLQQLQQSVDQFDEKSSGGDDMPHDENLNDQGDQEQINELHLKLDDQDDREQSADQQLGRKGHPPSSAEKPSQKKKKKKKKKQAKKDKMRKVHDADGTGDNETAGDAPSYDEMQRRHGGSLGVYGGSYNLPAPAAYLEPGRQI
jgi:hypothetical protein